MMRSGKYKRRWREEDNGKPEVEGRRWRTRRSRRRKEDK